MLLKLLNGLAANLRFSNGLQIIFRRLFDRNAREVTYIWRNRLNVVCDCARKDHVALQEVFCRDDYAGWLESCRFVESRICYVNIGAHIGAFDLWLHEQALRSDFSLAAELNPDTCERGRRNLAANGLKEITFINCGVAAEEGFVNFTPSSDSLGDSIFSPTGEAVGLALARPIELVSLPTLLARYADSNRRFDLLKLDCEGAEYGIVRTTPVAELRRFRYILTEFHPEPKGESVHEAYHKLQEAGFASSRGMPGAFRFVDLFTRDSVQRL